MADDYVTQGTVQVELQNHNILITIHPSKDYAVKHVKEDYIIFMNQNGGKDPKVFEASKKFKPDPNKYAQQVLIDAAFHNTCSGLMEVDTLKRDNAIYQSRCL